MQDQGKKKVEDLPPGGPTMSLTLDKRINIISLANLGTLVAIFVTALSTWYGLVSKVELLNTRIEFASAELSRIRTDVQGSIAQRDADIRSLRDKTETAVNRLTAVETQMMTIGATVQRIEQKMEPQPPVRR